RHRRRHRQALAPDRARLSRTRSGDAHRAERGQAAARSHQVGRGAPRARLDTLAMPAGQGRLAPARNARVAVFGSVLMPVLEFGDMACADGVAWVDRALAEAAALPYVLTAANSGWSPP